MSEATPIALDFYETGVDEPIGGVVLSTQGLAVGPPTTRSCALEAASSDAPVCCVLRLGLCGAVISKFVLVYSP